MPSNATTELNLLASKSTLSIFDVVLDLVADCGNFIFYFGTYELTL